MKDLVDEAVRKADDPSDSFFRERVSDLREISHIPIVNIVRGSGL